MNFHRRSPGVVAVLLVVLPLQQRYAANVQDERRDEHRARKPEGHLTGSSALIQRSVYCPRTRLIPGGKKGARRRKSRASLADQIWRGIHERSTHRKRSRDKTEDGLNMTLGSTSHELLLKSLPG